MIFMLQHKEKLTGRADLTPLFTKAYGVLFMLLCDNI